MAHIRKTGPCLLNLLFLSIIAFSLLLYLPLSKAEPIESFTNFEEEN